MVGALVAAGGGIVRYADLRYETPADKALETIFGANGIGADSTFVAGLYHWKDVAQRLNAAAGICFLLAIVVLWVWFGGRRSMRQ